MRKYLAIILLASLAIFNLATEAAPKIYVCPDCGCASDTVAFDKPGACPSCGMQLVEKIDNKEQRISVAVLLFDGAQVIDYAGPWEVFGEAGFRVFGVAEKREPIHATFAQKLMPDYTFADSPPADILLVPGGGVGRAVDNPELIKWVQKNAQKSTHVISVCTGAFILSKAGLLDGLSATTIEHAIDNLQKVSPKTKVVHDQRYVDNGKIITTAGLSSGIDGAFHLVAKIKGAGEAQAIALGMEYRWEPQAKYARAALADRYLPDLGDLKNMKGSIISTEGDLDHWEFKALVSEPNSIEAIADLLNHQIASKTPHAKGAVTLAPAGPNKSALDWNFTDDEGRAWKGEGKIDPAPDQPGQFVVSLKLARRPSAKSTGSITPLWRRSSRLTGSITSSSRSSTGNGKL
jgi:putative intracellular protease/amidase